MLKVPVSKYLILLLALLLSLPLTCYSGQPVSADGGAPNLAYVSGTSTGISVIDVGQSKVIRTLAVPGDPHTILLSLDGRFLYVTQPALEQVSILTANTGQTLCTSHLAGEPSLLALDSTSNTLYAAGNGAMLVSVIDITNCMIRRTFSTNSPVYGLAFGTIDGTQNILWTAGTHAISIFNTQSAQLLGTVAIAGNPRYLTMPQGSDAVYVTTQQGTVVAVDFKSHRTYPLLNGGIFGPMDYDALTSEVYVPDAQHKLIDVLSPIDSTTTTPPTEPERVLQLASAPQSIAITNDGLLGFVALQGGQVAMLDLLNRHVIYTLAVGGNPHFIITGLYPPTGTITLPPSPASSPQPQTTRSILPIIILLFTIASIAFLLFIVLLILFLRSQSKRHPHAR